MSDGYGSATLISCWGTEIIKIIYHFSRLTQGAQGDNDEQVKENLQLIGIWSNNLKLVISLF